MLRVSPLKEVIAEVRNGLFNAEARKTQSLRFGVRRLAASRPNCKGRAYALQK